MVNPKSIEVFLGIVEHGSISAVSRSMHFSQPTVSDYLNQLEDEIGSPLILRGKGQRNIVLTPIGEAFLPLAQKWIEHQKTLESLICQFKQEQQRNSLRLAASSGAHQLIVSNIVYKLIACCPGIDLKLLSVERREIPEAIDSYAFDIAFVFGDVHENELVTVVPIFEEQEFILCPANAMLPNRIITPADLDTRYEILYSSHKRSEKFRQWRSTCFPDAQWNDGELGFNVSSLFSIHNYLTDPRSWSVVPASIAMSNIAQSAGELSFRRMEPQPPKRICNVLISKAYKDRNLIEKFFQCCGAYIDSYSYMKKLF